MQVTRRVKPFGQQAVSYIAYVHEQGQDFCTHFGSLKPRIILQGKTVRNYDRKTGTHAPGVV